MLLYNLVGCSDHRARCDALDDRGASVLIEKAPDGAGAAAPPSAEPVVGWVALPIGRLRPAEDVDVDDDSDDGGLGGGDALGDGDNGAPGEGAPWAAEMEAME